MKCEVVFDFHSKHNNEYWYVCKTCGATDWFAYYDKPEKDKPIRGCKNDSRTSKTQTSDNQ